MAGVRESRGISAPHSIHRISSCGILLSCLQDEVAPPKEVEEDELPLDDDIGGDDDVDDDDGGGDMFDFSAEGDAHPKPAAKRKAVEAGAEGGGQRSKGAGSFSEEELAGSIHEVLSMFTAEGDEREYSTNQLMEQLQRTLRYRTLSLETIDQVCAFEVNLTCEWTCTPVPLLAPVLCQTCRDQPPPALRRF